jgi:hypothetical protein
MANEIDRLEIEVQAQAVKANAELEKLVGKLDKVSSSLSRINASGLKGMANGIQSLSVSMQSMSNVKTADFSRLARNIEKLGNIDQSKINGTASALRTISSALTASTGLTSGATQITELANSISKLGYKSASNAITNIPLMANALHGLMRTLSTSPQVSKNLINMTNALANLSSQGSKVRSATNSINGSLKRYSGATQQASANTKALTFSLAGLYAKLWLARRALGFLSGSVKKSMDFGETINLFQTSFKKIGVDTATELGADMGSAASEEFAKAFIDRAQDFNDKITDSLSLDPEMMMKYQAVFAQMANSMNLTAGTALNISDTFTLLGNDIASLWNIDTDNAMKKLQSGLAGQIRPLRELGVDISKTSLEMYALKYGIEDSVENMSQAAKVQLRWLAVMEQTEVAFGDMAKTIDSPANQLRVLSQQWTNLSRSIGNVFLPAVTTVLPYINALVISLRRMVDTLASAMGFELPDYSDSNIYTDVTGDIEGMGEEAEDATDFVEKLKKSVLGFDDLNILSNNKNKGISIDIGEGYSELDDAIGQKTISYMAKFNEELANMKNKAQEIADNIQPKIEAFFEILNELSPLFIGVATSIGAYAIINFFVGLAAKIGALAFTPAGVIALAIGGIAAIYSAIKEYNEKLVREDLAGRFGDIQLSMEDMEDVAQRITNSEYSAKLDVYISEKAKLDDLETNIQEDVNALNKLNWKIKVGLQLTPEEVSAYGATVEKFVSDSEAYIEQQHYVTKLAIDAVISNTNFNAEITALVDEYYNGSKGEMAQLGKDLRAEMDKSIADGIIDATEQKTIDNLIKEIAEINSQVANAEFKAKLQMITVDGELTPDSFKDLTKKIQDIIGERVGKAEDASYTVLSSVNAAYSLKMENATTPTEKKAIQTEWESAVKEITDNLSKTKAEISFDGTQFSLDSLLENYGLELDKVSGGVQEKTKTTFTTEVVNGITNADPSEGIKTLVDGMEWNYLAALGESEMSTATTNGLKEMLAGLEPSKEQYQKIYDDALKTGSQVPAGISAQLTDIQKLAALTGDRDAILYLIGQGMAESPEYLEMIKSGKLVGTELDNSLIAGMKSKIPDLELQAGKLVTKSGTAVSTKLTENKETIQGYGSRYINYFKGVFDNDGTAVLSVKGWLDKIGSEISGYKMPSISTSLLLNISGTDTSDPLGILNKKFKPNGYATGGFPNTGEAFIARENGIPEMVGKWGNRTAVANNDQIKGGIADAVKGAMIEVFAPMMSSLVGGNRNQSIEVPLYLDSEELARGIYDGLKSYDERMNPVKVF